jgi:hypothetical protein
MGATALVVIAVAAFLAWGLIRIGIRIGEAKTSRYLAKVLIQYLALESDSEETKEINQSLIDYGPWYTIGGNREDNTNREMRLSDIGVALARAGLHQGEESQRQSDALKPGQATVIMSRDELHSIAWLADYGLRAWTMRSDNEIRRQDDRLPKDRAEILSNLLDKFERKVADWLSETDDEREMRFSNYEDRMKRMWENYG